MQLIECARAAGVSADTLRHYLRVGLVKPEGRSTSGYRTFSHVSVERVRFIRSALSLGFSLRSIDELIGMSEKGKSPCPRARELLAVNIQERQEHLDATERLYRRMKAALREWKDTPDGVPDGHSVCSLIEGALSLETGEAMPRKHTR